MISSFQMSSGCLLLQCECSLISGWFSVQCWIICTLMNISGLAFLTIFPSTVTRKIPLFLFWFKTNRSSNVEFRQRRGQNTEKRFCSKDPPTITSAHKANMDYFCYCLVSSRRSRGARPGSVWPVMVYLQSGRKTDFPWEREAVGQSRHINYCSVKQRVILVNDYTEQEVETQLRADGGGTAVRVCFCVWDFNLTLQVDLIFRAVHQHWADWIQAVVVAAAERTRPRFCYLRNKNMTEFW